MENILETKIRQLKGRVQSGPAGKFFSWWTGELKQALPQSWQERLQHAQRRVTFLLQNGSYELAVDDNRNLRVLESIVRAQDREVQLQQIGDLLEEHDLAEAPRFLLLPLSSVLRKEVSLPLAAEANLAQVLAFEMDRQTPFKAATVFYDWNILERGGDSGQLRLELFVVPRADVAQNIEAVSGLGIPLSGIDAVDGGRSLGLNLLPSAERHRVVNRKTRLNLALAGAVALLLALVMTQSLYLRSHQVAELEEAIAEVQGEARQVMQIKERIEDSSEAAGFLATRRAQFPLVIEMLSEVTRILPDDTFLDRLVIGRENVQMQGKSQNAQQLIERVNESPQLDDAAFRGSTRLDARTGLEIFEVNAAVVLLEQGNDAG